MKFYKRFPGDIMKKTSGLSMAQFGAYDRLIDWCYANEAPVEPDEVYTITHAQTPADRRDVDKVLAKFFTLSADGYRQERIEEVIADALPRIEAARANGKKGGRPVTQTKPIGLFNETKHEPDAKASQSQSQNSSIPSEQKRERASRLPAGWELPDDWHEWAKAERPDLQPDAVAAKFADYWHSKPGKAGTKLDWFATWRNWVREEKAPRTNGHSGTGETAYQRSVRERVEEMAPSVARKAPGAIKPETIDAAARFLD